jgi:pimeloyl-ACP methyl ester carboxylesterase
MARIWGGDRRSRRCSGLRGPLTHLGLSKDGHPKHPLYIGYAVQPVRVARGGLTARRGAAASRTDKRRGGHADRGFHAGFVETNGIRLSVHRAGAGAPLILLHGYPQNHMSWEKVAPGFARHFDVIVPDLRGYGDSDAPPDDTEHTVYSKREMARDIVGMMDALGIGRAHVLGHDRGARVSYRLALDHPDRVDRLGIVEAVPTGDFWAAWTAELAFKAYHWTFLAQPAPAAGTHDPCRWAGIYRLDARQLGHVPRSFAVLEGGAGQLQATGQ